MVHHKPCTSVRRQSDVSLCMGFDTRCSAWKLIIPNHSLQFIFVDLVYSLSYRHVFFVSIASIDSKAVVFHFAVEVKEPYLWMFFMEFFRSCYDSEPVHDLSSRINAT